MGRGRLGAVNDEAGDVRSWVFERVGLPAPLGKDVGAREGEFVR